MGYGSLNIFEKLSNVLRNTGSRGGRGGIQLYTRCNQKITFIFKIHDLRMFDFRFFFFFLLLRLYIGPLYVLTISAILDCQSVLDR